MILSILIQAWARLLFWLQARLNRRLLAPSILSCLNLRRSRCFHQPRWNPSGACQTHGRPAYRSHLCSDSNWRTFVNSVHCSPAQVPAFTLLALSSRTLNCRRIDLVFSVLRVCPFYSKVGVFLKCHLSRHWLMICSPQCSLGKSVQVLHGRPNQRDCSRCRQTRSSRSVCFLPSPW